MSRLTPLFSVSVAYICYRRRGTAGTTTVAFGSSSSTPRDTRPSYHNSFSTRSVSDQLTHSIHHEAARQERASILDACLHLQSHHPISSSLLLSPLSFPPLPSPLYLSCRCSSRRPTRLVRPSSTSGWTRMRERRCAARAPSSAQAQDPPHGSSPPPRYTDTLIDRERESQMSSGGDGGDETPTHRRHPARGLIPPPHTHSYPIPSPYVH